MGFLEAVGQASPAILSNIGQMKQMAIQDQQEKREAVKFDYLQKKMIDEERQDNAPVPLSLLQTTPLAQHPRAFNLLLENARQNGAVGKTVGGEEFITKKNLKGVLDTMKLGTEAGNMWIGELLNDKKAQVANLYQTMQSGKVKKPEEIEHLKKQYRSATEDLIELTRLNDPDFIKEYAKTQEMMKRALYEQQVKPPSYHQVPIDDQTATVRYDPVTGKEELISTGPRWSPREEKPEKPEMTPGQALANIRKAEEAKVKTGKTTVVDQLLARAYNLEEGAPMDDTTKKAIMDAADEEIAYYRQFAPGGTSARKTGAKPGTATAPTIDDVTNALKGKPAGRRYKVAGKVYIWDGTTATPE